VPGVGEHRAILHALEVGRAEHVAGAGDRDEHVSALGGRERRHDLVAVHPRLESAQGIDLADDDRGPVPLRPHGDPLAGPAVAQDDDAAPRQQQVGGAHDAVERRLAGAVAVVEGALREGFVHRDDRAGERPLGFERPQADEAGRGLLRAAEEPGQEVLATGVDGGHEVGPVVERHARGGGNHRGDARGPRVDSLPVDGVHLRLAVGDERRRDVVLRRQRVRRAEGHLRPAGA
jgi:hypothetical protein